MGTLSKEILKKYGGNLLSGDFFKKQKKQIVPISPSWDLHMGGLEEGTWTIISGLPKVGKTTSVLQMCANAQAMGKHVYYQIPEGRLKDRDMSGVEGFSIDDDLFTPISSTEEKLLSAEDHLEIGRDILKNIPGCVWVLDSSSALCAQKEQAGEITAQARNDGPKLLATFCRQMASVVPANRSIVIIIQHLIANTSGYGAKYMEDGGNKIQYQADNKMRCRGRADWMDGDNQVGQVVTWDIETASLKKPGQKFDSYLRYGFGLDKFMEITQLSVDLGFIEKGGAWFTLPDKTKIQGENKLREHIATNPKLYNELYAKIKEIV